MKITPVGRVVCQPAGFGRQSQAQSSARLAAHAANNAIDSVRGIRSQAI